MEKEVEGGTTQHKFRRYASIENHQLEADSIRNGGYAGGEWVVMEKVHGSNFCFVTDGRTVSAARRQSLLAPGEQYYPGWEDFLASHTEKVLHLYRLLQAHYSRSNDVDGDGDGDGGKAGTTQIKLVHVYGELFGGMYPGLDTPASQRHIQKGIYYSPTYGFYAFDVHNGRAYLDYELAEKVFKEAGFFYAEALFRGTFEECLAYPHEFTTTIPARLGLPGLVGKRYEGYKNLAEGVVIRPNTNAYFPTGSRVILKKKIDLYSEIIDVKKPKPSQHKGCAPRPSTETRLEKELDGLDPENAERVRWLWAELSRFINHNRLEAVVSKLGEEAVDQSARGKLIGLLAQDARDDLLKYQEARQRYEALPKEHHRLITRRLNTMAAVPVGKYLSKSNNKSLHESQV